MSWLPWISNLVGVPGAILAIFLVVQTVRDSRGNIFLQRAQGFLALRDAIAALGPIGSPIATIDSPRVHKELLDSLDQGARANSYIFARNVGRLGRPGSFPKAIGLMLYGLIVLVVSVSALIQLLDELNGQATYLSLIPGVVVCVGALLCSLGIAQLVRRVGTRRIRAKVGLIDVTTVEGLAFYFRNFVHWLRRVAVTPRS